LARDLPRSRDGGHCGSTRPVLPSRQFGAWSRCSPGRRPSGCRLAGGRRSTGAARSNAPGGQARQQHLPRPSRERAMCRLPRHRRKRLASGPRPHERQMAMGRRQFRCDRPHDHRRRSAPEGIRRSHAADGRGPVVVFPGFSHRSLYLGAEPPEWTLNATGSGPAEPHRSFQPLDDEARRHPFGQTAKSHALRIQKATNEPGPWSKVRAAGQPMQAHKDQIDR
jgi:hypothetical protein